MGGGGGKGGGRQVIGYRYFLGLHMAICHGPVDAIGPVYAGERQITGLSAGYSGNPGESIVQSTASSPNLFGGEKKEGGISGTVDFMFGADDQAQNDYLLSQPDITADNLPAFRGIVSAVARKIYIAAMNPYPKPWWFTVKNIPQRDWYSATAEVPAGSGSANGAHIIRETIINPDWGMGYSFDRVDDTSFRSAADTLLAEGFGLSLQLSGQGSIEEFIQHILRHINGVLYTDRTTGRYILRMIRDDYTVGNLPVFDDSNTVSLSSFQRPTFAELVNEIVLVYRPRGATQDAAVTFQDLASVEAQGGVVSQTVQFPGIDTATIAARVGVRELRQQSTPLAQVRMTVNRQGWDINPGDPFILRWPAYGIDQIVLRALKVDYGNVLQNRIEIEAVEDVFGLPAASYSEPQDPIWTDPVTDPVPVPQVKLVETPFYEIATSFTGASVYIPTLEDTDTFLMGLATEPSSASASYQLWTKLSSQLEFIFRINGPYTTAVTIDADIGRQDTDDISVTGLTEFGVIDIEIGSYAFLNEEVVRVDEIDVGAGTVNIGRGCLDTLPAEHAAGSRLWFGDSAAAIDFTEYQQGNVVNTKSLTQTGNGVLPIASATQFDITMQGRQYRPYPPANVRFRQGFGLAYWPSVVWGAITSGVALYHPTRLQWVNRNRLTQTVPGDILDWFDGNVTPEEGVTYELRYFQEGDIFNTPENETRQYIESGPSTVSGYWQDEIDDTDRLEYSPIDGQDLDMPFTDDSIGGTLSPASQAQNVSNVTFGNGRATHNDGYFEIGDFVLSTDAAIVFTFNADGDGEEDQFLFGKHSIVGAGGRNLIGVWYRKDGQRVGISTYNSDVISDTDFRVLPSHDYTIFIRKAGASIQYYADGVLLINTSIGSLTGRPWVIGADWDANDGIRNHFYRGIVKDLRIYDDQDVQVSDIFGGKRANRYFRAVVQSVRTETDPAGTHRSLQEFDYTVPERLGFGLDWNNDWNSRR